MADICIMQFPLCFPFYFPAERQAALMQFPLYFPFFFAGE